MTWEEDDDDGPQLDGFEDAIEHVLDRYPYIAGEGRSALRDDDEDEDGVQPPRATTSGKPTNGPGRATSSSTVPTSRKSTRACNVGGGTSRRDNGRIRNGSRVRRPCLDGRARCRESQFQGVNFFAHSINRRGEPTPAAEIAKAVCSECVVQDDCLDYALAIDERNGIWGGMTPEKRRDVIQDES